MVAAGLLSLVLSGPSWSAPPTGFTATTLDSDLASINGMEPIGDGRAIAWSRLGYLWLVRKDGTRVDTPILNINHEIGIFGDHGLLGMVLDPQFLQNGRIYLSYVADRYQVMHGNDPDYDPTMSWPTQATIARVTCYVASVADDFQIIDPATRLVLIGETMQTGIPVLHLSHDIGGLAFGSDGTLLVSTGDSSNFNYIDTGGNLPGSFVAQALADGIIRPAEDVGSFRSQLPGSLCGKVLRIDPDTGDGVPSNPYFDPANPRSAQSRVWALGLRNPYRMCLQPGTGVTDPDDGRPGTLVIADVGAGSFEEIDVASAGGTNFGWPIYEGLNPNTDYSVLSIANLDAPNPLGDAVCPTHFSFRQLLDEASRSGVPSLFNPCAVEPTPIPASIPQFVHLRPALAYYHWGDLVWFPTWNGDAPASTLLGAADCPVQGVPFRGSCIIGGSFHAGLNWPEPYAGAYYVGDFVGHWVRCLDFASDGTVQAIHEFDANAGLVTDLFSGVFTGQLRISRLSTPPIAIQWDPPSEPPVVIASITPTFGLSPLVVQYNASESFDPEGGLLTFEWAFGDGERSLLDRGDKLYTATDGGVHNFTVTLRVTDEDGVVTTKTFVVSLNNTPPEVEILSPFEGQMYSLEDYTGLPLRASVRDNEHAAEEISCEWILRLHHDTHHHDDPPDANCEATAVIAPLGCGAESYHFEIIFTATDPGGLATTVSRHVMPDCDNWLSCPADFDHDGAVGGSDIAVFVSAWGQGYGPADLNADGVVDGTDLGICLSLWGHCGP